MLRIVKSSVQLHECMLLWVSSGELMLLMVFHFAAGICSAGPRSAKGVGRSAQ